MNRIRDKGETFRKGLERFERSLPQAETALQKTGYSLFNSKFNACWCIFSEFSLLDFIRVFKLEKKDFPDEFGKLKMLQEARKQLFDAYEEKSMYCVQGEYHIQVSSYTYNLEEVFYDDTEYSFIALTNSLDRVHYLQRFARNSGIRLDPKVTKEFERLLALLKERMEEFVETYPGTRNHNPSGPIDHSKWWNYMGRIVVEKEMNEEAKNKDLTLAEPEDEVQ